MRLKEKGFATLEVLAALAIVAFLSSAAANTTFQVFRYTDRQNSHAVVVSQVQNAGHWLSRDVQLADSIVVDSTNPDAFIIMTWTEQNYDTSQTTRYSITYHFEDLSGNVGKLMRTYWSSAGQNSELLLGKYISYNPADPVNTTSVSYTTPTLTMKVKAVFGASQETREFRISRRPTL